MKHSTLPWLAIWAVAAVIGCGGDDPDAPSGGAKCTQTSPCGGDITGEWKIVDFCPDTNKVPQEVKDICETATLDYDKANVSGSISYKADKSYSLTSTASGTGYVVLGADCLKQSGGVTLTCKQVEEAINQNTKEASQKVSCASSGSGCRCALNLSETATSTGTYAVSGNGVTLTDKDSKKLESQFCVKGSTLYMSVNLATGSSGGMGYEFAGQLEAEK